MAQNNNTATFIAAQEVGNSPFKYGKVYFSGKQVGTFDFTHIEGKFKVGIYPGYFMTRDTEEQARQDATEWLRQHKVTCDCYIGTSGIRI